MPENIMQITYYRFDEILETKQRSKCSCSKKYRLELYTLKIGNKEIRGCFVVGMTRGAKQRERDHDTKMCIKLWKPETFETFLRGQPIVTNEKGGQTRSNATLFAIWEPLNWHNSAKISYQRIFVFSLFFWVIGNNSRIFYQ